MSIAIISQSREFSAVEKYLLTLSQDITVLKDVSDETVIPVDGYLVFNDTKESTGETVEILSIITPDKKVYSCQSKTFKKSLEDIVACVDGAKFSIIKRSGKTKANRDFITCALDVTSLSL